MGEVCLDVVDTAHSRNSGWTEGRAGAAGTGEGRRQPSVKGRPERQEHCRRLSPCESPAPLGAQGSQGLYQPRPASRIFEIAVAIRPLQTC